MTIPPALAVSGPPIRLIAGPTASGKSALALELAERTGGVIVNADALQLYADLRVLTARPTPDEEALAPHRLYGVADASETWSAGRWLRAALDVLESTRAEGRTAILVGGTGLYFKSLTEGLAPTPAIPAEVRAELRKRFEEMGESDFRGLLAGVDPDSAERISTGDRQRLLRALEVFVATGKTLGQWRKRTIAPLAPEDWAAVVVEPERDVLYARCDARLDAMVREGALDEVEALIQRDLGPDAPAMKAVGVRDLARHLAGECDLAAAVDAARRETRRYAKRQLTWFRHQASSWPRIDPLSPRAH